MWNLRLMGPFQLSDASGVRSLSPKTQALLGLLSMAGPDGMSREQVMSLLWQDSPAARARQSLRQVLSDLRSQAPIVLIAGTDRLSLDFERVRVDLLSIRAAAQSPDCIVLEEVAAACAGPLLQGMGETGEAFDEWLTRERERTERLACSVFENLAIAHALAGRHDLAVPVLQRWLAVDACNESAHRALMLAWIGLNRRSDALAQYERCRDTLRRAFGAVPQPETTNLRDSMRTSAQPIPIPPTRKPGRRWGPHRCAWGRPCSASSQSSAG